MGFKTAYALVKQGKTVEKTLAMMKTHARWSTLMTDEYADNVRKAFETFRYSLVYDKALSKAVHLQDLPEHLCHQGNDHLGPPMDPDAVYKIAHGIINPISKKPYQVSTDNLSQWHEARQQPRNTQGIFAHVYSKTSSDNGEEETCKASSLSLFFESGNKSTSAVAVSQGSSTVVHGTKRPSSSQPIRSRGKDFPKQTKTMRDFFGPKQAGWACGRKQSNSSSSISSRLESVFKVNWSPTNTRIGSHITSRGANLRNHSLASNISLHDSNLLEE